MRSPGSLAAMGSLLLRGEGSEHTSNRDGMNE